VLLPDHSAFKAGSLKSRKLNIDDKVIEEYLISRADDVLDFYTKSVSPQILIAKNFGDIQMSQVISKINSQYELAKSARESELIAEGVDEVKRIKEIQKVTNEQEKAIKDVEALRDKLYGQYNRPNDPASFWNQSGHYVKAYNFTRLLGGMTIAAIPDLALSALVKAALANRLEPASTALSALVLWPENSVISE